MGSTRPDIASVSVKDKTTICLLFAVLCLSFIELNSASLIKNPNRNEKRERFVLDSFCRKYVLSPPCRGVQKRDIIDRLEDGYKYASNSPTAPSDLGGMDRPNLNELFINNPTLFGELLRKAIPRRQPDSEDN